MGYEKLTGNAYAAEGVKLSGVFLRRGLYADSALEKLIRLSAEGATCVSHMNLSGKRTKKGAYYYATVF